MYRRYYPNFRGLLKRRPDAVANIMGGADYPDIVGTVRFYQTPYGVLTVAEIMGLPSDGVCGNPIFGFHIHDGKSCRGSAADPFSGVGMHYNPEACPHPYHAGDLPPLFGAGGFAFTTVLTERFTVDEIIGRTVIIHSHPDDFMTQPSGNSGQKIACGEILSMRWH